MSKRQGTPDEARIAALYQKITGRPMTRGAWDIGKRDFAQKIAYVEQACRSVLEAIDELEKSTEPEQVAAALTALKTEFDFLNTLKLR